MAESISVNAEFTEDIWDPTKYMREDLPDGVYPCKVESIETKSKDGRPRYELQTVVASGDHAGSPLKAVIFGDFSKSANVKKLKTALVSAGVEASSLVGKKSFDLSKIVGRQVQLLVRNAPEGEVDEKGRRPFPDVDFVTKEQAAAYAKAGAPAKKSNGSNGAPKTEAAPAAAAGGDTSLDNLFPKS